jgi:hypothetical protein
MEEIILLSIVETDDIVLLKKLGKAFFFTYLSNVISLLSFIPGRSHSVRYNELKQNILQLNESQI